jgi:hypothetical protein
MMSFADFSAGKRLLPVGLDGPAPPRMPAESHEHMRRTFTPQVRPGDAVYYYCSDQAEWDQLMGSEGYILVRDGRVVDSVVVRMN